MLIGLLICALIFILTLASYADRVYSEMGKFLAREYQDNVDAWVERMEPRLGLSRDSLALSSSLLRQTSLGGIAVVLGVLLVHGAGASAAGVRWSGVGATLAELALLIIIFDRMLPQVLFARTRGEWVSRMRLVWQTLFYIILPVTLLLGLLLSIASLAEHAPEHEPERQDEGVNALLEAGEEEGILEQSDSALVRSVVEFGDMVVREVMTPRPEIFAVPDSMSLAQFTAELQKSAFSRVPVYAGQLDNVTGIAFAHDLLQIADTDAQLRTVAEIQRSAAFVPEPKKVNELLREMQREKQHMRIVIDEYGTVAGLVTIEDLLEAIVGNIEDEHETPVANEQVERESDGSFVVPGNLDVADLRDLFTSADAEQDADPVNLRLPSNLEATTVGGLVSELTGHIPLPGEVVETGGIRLQVLASTSRLVTRVRAQLVAPEEQEEV